MYCEVEVVNGKIVPMVGDPCRAELNKCQKQVQGAVGPGGSQDGADVARKSAERLESHRRHVTQPTTPDFSVGDP